MTTVRQMKCSHWNNLWAWFHKLDGEQDIMLLLPCIVHSCSTCLVFALCHCTELTQHHIILPQFCVAGNDVPAHSSDSGWNIDGYSPVIRNVSLAAGHYGPFNGASYKLFLFSGRLYRQCAFRRKAYFLIPHATVSYPDISGYATCMYMSPSCMT